MRRLLLWLVTAVALLPADAVAARRGGPGPGGGPGGPSPGGNPDVQPANVVLVDANDRQVGRVVGAPFPEQVMVALRVKGRGVILRVSHAVVGQTLEGAPILPLGGTGERVHFESTDCLGTPLIDQRVDALTPGSVVTAPGMTLYVPVDEDTPPATITWRSSIGSDGVCRPTVNPAGETRSLVPAIPLLDFFTIWTLPFRVLFLPL